MNGACFQTKCSDVVRQSLAAPSDVSGSHCSVLLDKAPPCRPQSQSNVAAFTEGWGSGEGSLTLCAPPRARERSPRKADLLFYYLFIFLPLWFSVDRSVLRHAFIYSSAVLCSSLSRIPALLWTFYIPSLSPSFHFSSIFSTRDCAVPSASNICSSGFLLLPLLPPFPLLPLLPAFLSPPTLKCFSSVCLASNPPQSLLSFIHENADPQQGREKRQQT